MKSKKTNMYLSVVLLAMSLIALDLHAFAQSESKAQSAESVAITSKKTNGPILYHGGPVMTGTQDVYVIWYGCWDGSCGDGADLATQSIVIDFLSNVGGSPYFQINAMYTNSSGQGPSGATLYGGSVNDRYSHGVELTASDIQGIVADQIVSNGLPQDPSGIYVVIASPDVSSEATRFCVAWAQPHHGIAYALGSGSKYAFVGSPTRCPNIAAPQFVTRRGIQPTPNANLAADGMANTLAHVLSTVITNPSGGAWFDRYGLQNADKCDGQFGSTYVTANGARANLKLGQRDYLIQENWVNSTKGHCAMNSSL
jgi:hypothetical protein